ncbi:MAG: MarR family transcriptional regulator [Gordonia sp. (in: high G+C Gram-positive bacteria)]
MSDAVVPEPEAAPTPDEVWALMVHAVMDTRDAWRRETVARTGLPFSRLRVLRRVGRGGPLSLKDLAYAAALDAPATTVAVNELEAEGLVRREVDPTNRRRKLVSLTDAGAAVITRVEETSDPPPPGFADIGDDELRALARLFGGLE